MATITRVLRAVVRTAAVADDVSAAFARELARVLRETERQLAAVVDDAAAGNRTAIVRAARASQVRSEIRDLLREAGYDALAEAATATPLDQIAQQVLTTRRLARQSADLSTSLRTKMEALKTLQLGDLLDQADDVTTALWQATIRGVFGSRPPAAILRDLGDVIDAHEPQIQTLYDTAVSIYGRQVEALQAGPDPDATFAYFGPVDKKTRPFCLKHAGKVYTRQQIDRLDNGQLDNVFLTGGGYNCRHVWTEVSKFSELQDLVWTKERVPEVGDQLAALREAA